MIYIPDIIKIGLRDRSGTYTGRLAYIIYRDAKGKWRKEPSWNGWRDHSIEPEQYENEPTEGFVLNKKVGGVTYSSWDARQTYCRVYDPRGFEFEITVPNLLYILQNTNSVKGKGLEGAFVYGWSGIELLLIPTGAPEYEELKGVSTKAINAKRFTVKDMIPGATYLDNKGKQLVYLDYSYRHANNTYSGKELGEKYTSKYYYFMNSDESIILISSLTKSIIDCIDTTPHPRFAFFIDKLNEDSEYVPIAPELDEYIVVDPSEIIEWHTSTRNDENLGNFRFYKHKAVYITNDRGEYILVWINKVMDRPERLRLSCAPSWEWYNLEKLVNKYTFYYRKRYLVNGRVHSIGAYI